MSVRIISDSACDMNLETAQKHNVDLLHLKVTIDDKDYFDGLDLSHDEFMIKLEKAKNIPITTQITPYEYEEFFKNNLGNDELIYICLSSKLSGCYNSALTAANNVDNDRIFVVDSLNASLGQYALLLYAIRLRDEGKTAKEIFELLNIQKKKIKLIARIDTLEYLQKGGRLSKSAAVIGNLINIKPVIGVENGEVVVLGKARGAKKGDNMLTEFAKTKNSGGINYSMPFILAYSGLSDKLLTEYVDNNFHLVEGKLDPTTVPRISIGAAIGTHVGPGAIGVAFFSREDFS